MPKCKPISIKYRRVCVGDLNRRIRLRTREISTPTTDVDFGHSFTDIETWAAVQTVVGRNMFSGTNFDQAVSHLFYIRYRTGITAETWIEYRNENYDILDVENLEETNSFLVLICNVRGSTTQPVNNA